MRGDGRPQPRFAVSKAPLPLFAIRAIALHDVFFLSERPHWFQQYRERFGKFFGPGSTVMDPLLVERYQEAEQLTVVRRRRCRRPPGHRWGAPTLLESPTSETCLETGPGRWERLLVGQHAVDAAQTKTRTPNVLPSNGVRHPPVHLTDRAAAEGDSAVGWTGVVTSPVVRLEHDGRCRPLFLVVTGGQQADCPQEIAAGGGNDHTVIVESHVAAPGV